MNKFAFSPPKIGLRLLFFILAFSAVAALLATSVQLYVTYNRDLAAIEDVKVQIRKSYLPILTDAVWTTDQHQTDHLLRGIDQLPNVQYAQIRLTGGETFAVTGDPATEKIKRFSVPISYSYKGRDLLLGTLEIGFTYDEIHQRLYDEAAIILIAQGTKAFFVSLFILFLFHTLVTRHLLRISDYFESMDPENPKDVLVLDRRFSARGDELDQVVTAINAMRQRFLANKEEQAQLLASLRAKSEELGKNVVELRAAEQELIKSEEQNRTVLSRSIDGFLTNDAQGCFLDANDAYCRMVGYSLAELRSMRISDLEAREAPEEVARHIETVMWTGNDRFETAHFHKNGEVVDLEFSVNFDASLGNIFFSFVRDITERKKTEEALYLQGEIMANMAEGVYLIRAADGIIVFTNEKLEEMFGYGPGEMIGRHVAIVNAPTDKSPAETAREIMANITARGSWRGEVCNIKKDGTAFWCQASVSRFNHPSLGSVMISIHTDITERRQAQEALAESENRSRIILSRSMDGFFSSDMAGRFVDANEAFCSMVGYSREQLLGMTVPDIEANESPEDVARRIEKIIRSGNERFESRHRHRDGQLVDVEISVTYDHSFGGFFYAFVRDISARKLAEDALRENEEKLRLIFESSMDAIYQMDREGIFTVMNRAGAEIFGYSPEEIIGRHFSFLVPEVAVGEGAKAMRKALSGENVQGEILVRRRQGQLFTVSFSLAPLKKEERIVGVTGISRDITDRLQEEEKQLRESLAEKESLLKEIHHRVKNNMQIISSLLSLQSMQSLNPEVLAAIRDSQNRVKTMGLIHEKLYKTENLARIDFSDYLRTLTEYLASTYTTTSRRVQIVIAVKDVFLSADTAIPCGLIVTELVTNSFKYAFADRQQGRIEISMAHADGGRIMLSIRDNGCGLPSGFSIDKSDSLGMSLVQNLARQMEAVLIFQNDNGAVCRLEFAADDR